MAPPRCIRACPAYFGAKAQVLRDIFAAVDQVLPREAWPRSTFVDCFLGGGSVSVMAKRLGFRVLANDLAARSVLIGNALVANDRVRLAQVDEQRLHVAHPGNDHRIEASFAPKFFLPGHARWLDNAFAVARATPCPTKRALLHLVLMHAILAIRPFGDFSRSEVTEKFAAGDFDGVSLSVRGVRRILELTPSQLVDGLRDRVNAGVFANGHRHEIHQRDALDFVAAVEGDVWYGDPPYLGSNSYEATYRGLDMILEGRDEPRETSGFNAPGALQLLDDLLDRAAHIPAWVLSFGGGKVTHDELLARVQRHRPARLANIDIRYRTGTAGGGDSGRRREILIVARKGGLP